MVTMSLSMATSLRCSSFSSTYSFGSSHSCTPSHRPAELRPISSVKPRKIIKRIGSEISSPPLQEFSILAYYLHGKFGVSILFSLSVAAAAIFSIPLEDGCDVTATVEEQIKFDVVIDEVASCHRIPVFKAIRTMAFLAVMEAKELMEDFPKTFKKGVTKDEAEEAKRQLEEAGAKVSIVQVIEI